MVKLALNKVYLSGSVMKLFVSENRKKYETSSLFAALCLEEYSGMDIGGFQIYKDEYGKPWCKSADGAQYYFSISHSGNVIMCAVDEYNIGFDCQFINRDYKSCVKIADRFFHGGELEVLSLSSSEDEYMDLFFEIWAKKEAYAKFTGRGLADKLTKFNSVDVSYARNFFIIPYKKEIKLAMYSETFSGGCLNNIIVF